MMDSADIYGDIEDFDFGTELDRLETKNHQLSGQIELLENNVASMSSTIRELKIVQKNLTKNISQLFKTAQGEVARQKRTIAELREKLEVYERPRNTRDHWKEQAEPRVEWSQQTDPNGPWSSEDINPTRYSPNFFERNQGRGLEKRSRSRSPNGRKRYRNHDEERGGREDRIRDDRNRGEEHSDSFDGKRRRMDNRPFNPRYRGGGGRRNFPDSNRNRHRPETDDSRRQPFWGQGNTPRSPSPKSNRLQYWNPNNEPRSPSPELVTEEDPQVKQEQLPRRKGRPEHPVMPLPKFFKVGLTDKQEKVKTYSKKQKVKLEDYRARKNPEEGEITSSPEVPQREIIPSQQKVSKPSLDTLDHLNELSKVDLENDLNLSCDKSTEFLVKETEIINNKSMEEKTKTNVDEDVKLASQESKTSEPSTFKRNLALFGPENDDFTINVDAFKSHQATGKEKKDIKTNTQETKSESQESQSEPQVQTFMQENSCIKETSESKGISLERSQMISGIVQEKSKMIGVERQASNEEVDFINTVKYPIIPKKVEGPKTPSSKAKSVSRLESFSKPTKKLETSLKKPEATSKKLEGSLKKKEPLDKKSHSTGKLAEPLEKKRQPSGKPAETSEKKLETKEKKPKSEKLEKKKKKEKSSEKKSETEKKSKTNEKKKSETSKEEKKKSTEAKAKSTKPIKEVSKPTEEVPKPTKEVPKPTEEVPKPTEVHKPTEVPKPEDKTDLKANPKRRRITPIKLKVNPTKVEEPKPLPEPKKTEPVLQALSLPHLITPIKEPPPIQTKPLSTFENILKDKTPKGHNMKELDLTHDGEIPTLHILENTSRSTDNSTLAQGKQILKMIDNMDTSPNLDIKTPTPPETKKESSMPLSFTNCLGENKNESTINTPLGQSCAMPNSSINSTISSARPLIRKRPRCVVKLQS